jgi:DNA-binding NarL/FixJ family response regulator
MLKILIVDDHAALRLGLQRILREALGETAFGEAGNAREALELCARESWDLILLDVALPDRSGLETLRALRRRRHPPPVLVLSMSAEEIYAVSALRLGAMGYLSKQSASEELVEAVRKVLAGGKYLSPALAEKLGSDPDTPLDDCPDCDSVRTV